MNTNREPLKKSIHNVHLRAEEICCIEPHPGPQLPLLAWLVLRIRRQLLGALLFASCHGAMAQVGGFVADPHSFVDTEFLSSGALEMINAQYAYARGYTGKGVLVAILDSGLYALHPEFRGRVAGGYNYDDDLPPWDFSDTEIDSETGLLEGHGTHVAGIVAASRDGAGMHGVAYESSLLAIRGNTDKDWIGIDYAIAKGAKVFNGSYGPDAYPSMGMPDPHDPDNEIRNPYYDKYINGPYTKYQALDPEEIINQHAPLLRRAAAADMVMVFAAGNDFRYYHDQASNPLGYGMYHLITPSYWDAPGNDPFYRFIDENHPGTNIYDPSTYVTIGFDDPQLQGLDLSDLGGTMLSVVALDPNGEIASYSNRCGEVWHYCLAAPGGDDSIDNSEQAPIWSTHPEPSLNYYKAMDGTSMAAPVVAGAAAILRQAFPYMTARQIIETLLTSTENSGIYADQGIYGRGLLDLGKAVLGPGEFGAEGFANMFKIDTQGHDTLFGNNIAGTGGLHKTGAGTLYMNGYNTYTGPTLIDGGRLVVNGENIHSPLTIGSKAALGGAGTVAQATIFGRLAPGNSIGTITFLPIEPSTIALQAEPGSVFEIEVDADGSSDMLDVQGDAQLLGGEIQLIGLNGAVLGQQFEFMTVTGNIDGPGFSGVSNPYVFADIGLVQAGNSFSLAVARNSTSFASLGKNRNQRNTGAAIESLGAGALPYEALITLQNAGRAPGMFDQYSGELHATLRSSMHADTTLVRRSIMGRLAHTQAAGKPGNDLWGQALAAWGEHGSNSISHKASRFSSGFLLGRDFALGDSSGLGLALAYTRSRTRAENRNQGTLDAWHLMAYGSTTAGPLSLRGGLGHSLYTLDTHRNISNPDLGRHTARYNGRATSLFAEAGISLPMGTATIEPYMAVSQVWQSTSGFTEDGKARLKGKRGRDSFTQGELGTRAHWQTHTSAGDLTLSAGASWLHTFGSLSPHARLAYAGGSGHELAGAPLARNAMRLELKASLARTASTSLDLSYQGQLGGGFREHGLRLQVSHRF